MKIVVSHEIEQVCESFVGACIEATVTNTPYSTTLWDEIKVRCDEFKNKYTTETLKDIPAILATRRVYKTCGKDPSRYRPAAEALLRRVLQGKDLYQVDTIVDITNLASMVSGYSLGAFDVDMISGDTLTLGIGREGEPYEGIGRGMLNIARLPVYRDNIGGVGTPTSDNERTKINIHTRRLLVLINGYDGNEDAVRTTAVNIVRMLKDYCEAHDASYFIYKCDNKQ